MRKFLTTAMAVALASATSYADLQNIEVNGGIRLRGSSYSGGDGPGDRATQFTEQRTNLGWTADFTDEVSAVIEMDSYNIWGDDGRGDVVGGPGTAGGLGEVSLYQASLNSAKPGAQPLTSKLVVRKLFSEVNSWWVTTQPEVTSLRTASTVLPWSTIRIPTT